MCDLVTKSNQDKASIILETERLRLRWVQPSDVPTLVDLWCDPDVTRYMGGPRDRAELEAIFEEDTQDPFTEQYDLWPVEEKQTGRVIGHCGLIDKQVEGETEIELVYVFAQSAWGKGYATEIGEVLKEHAFEHMRLQRLIALIDPGNEPSERVAIKVGMHLEKEVVRPGGAVRRLYIIEAQGE
jgi:RimJ/RimL family protein N-acetyltransferase